jgi:hypothetical protein
MRLRAHAYLVDVLILIVILVIILSHRGVLDRLLGGRSLALALDVGGGRAILVLRVGDSHGLGGSVLGSHDCY